MSVASEIQRIKTAKQDLINTIKEKGVEVADNATLDTLPQIIEDNLSAGGGSEPGNYLKDILYTGSASSYSCGFFAKFINKIPPFKVDASASSFNYTFYNYEGIEIDFSLCNTNNIRSFNYTVYNCPNIKELDMHTFGTSKIGNAQYMISNCAELRKVNLRNLNTSDTAPNSFSYMFMNNPKLAVIEIDKLDINKPNWKTDMFKNCGTNCLQSDGAYADGITYVYVKNEACQTAVLTSSNVPSNWSTANVVIAGSEQDLRTS